MRAWLLLLAWLLAVVPCAAQDRANYMIARSVIPGTCDDGNTIILTAASGGFIAGAMLVCFNNVFTPVLPAAILASGTALPSTCIVGATFTITTTATFYICASVDTWTEVGAGSGGVPTGAIIFVASGSCPATYTEVAGLNGRMVRGTLAANGNVGTTGGADSVTPTFTGNSVASNAVSAGTPAGTNGTGTVTPLGTVAAPVFTGSALGTHTHTTTATGTNSVPTFTGSALATHAHELPFQIASTTIFRQIAAGTFGTGTSRAATSTQTHTANTTSAAVALSQAVTAGTPAGTVTAPTFTGNSVVSSAVSAGTPAGTNNAPAFTGSSSVTSAQTFTGSALGTHSHTTTATGTISAVDTRAAYLFLIACSKN
jgi:hypothetical protein